MRIKLRRFIVLPVLAASLILSASEHAQMLS